MKVGSRMKVSKHIEGTEPEGLPGPAEPTLARKKFQIQSILFFGNKVNRSYKPSEAVHAFAWIDEASRCTETA